MGARSEEDSETSPVTLAFTTWYYLVIDKTHPFGYLTRTGGFEYNETPGYKL